MRKLRVTIRFFFKATGPFGVRRLAGNGMRDTYKKVNTPFGTKDYGVSLMAIHFFSGVPVITSRLTAHGRLRFSVQSAFFLAVGKLGWSPDAGAFEGSWAGPVV